MGGTETNVQLKISVQLQHHGQYNAIINAFINANNAARLLKSLIWDVASNLHKLQADHSLGRQPDKEAYIFLFTIQLSALKGECQRGHAYCQYPKRGG